MRFLCVNNKFIRFSKINELQLNYFTTVWYFGYAAACFFLITQLFVCPVIMHF